MSLFFISRSREFEGTSIRGKDGRSSGSRQERSRAREIRSFSSCLWSTLPNPNVSDIALVLVTPIRPFCDLLGNTRHVGHTPYNFVLGLSPVGSRIEVPHFGTCRSFILGFFSLLSFTLVISVCVSNTSCFFTRSTTSEGVCYCPL